MKNSCSSSRIRAWARRAALGQMLALRRRGVRRVQPKARFGGTRKSREYRSCRSRRRSRVTIQLGSANRGAAGGEDQTFARQMLRGGDGEIVAQLRFVAVEPAGGDELAVAESAVFDFGEADDWRARRVG